MLIRTGNIQKVKEKKDGQGLAMLCGDIGHKEDFFLFCVMPNNTGKKEISRSGNWAIISANFHTSLKAHMPQMPLSEWEDSMSKGMTVLAAAAESELSAGQPSAWVTRLSIAESHGSSQRQKA